MNELSILYTIFNKKQLTTITLASARTKALHVLLVFLWRTPGYLYKEKVLASYGFLIHYYQFSPLSFPYKYYVSPFSVI